MVPHSKLTHPDDRAARGTALAKIVTGFADITDQRNAEAA